MRAHAPSQQAGGRHADAMPKRSVPERPPMRALPFHGQLPSSARSRATSPHQLRAEHWRLERPSSRPLSVSRGERQPLTLAFAAPALPRDTPPSSFPAFSYLPDIGSPDAAPRPLPRAVENVADDPQLANPLLRQRRLGTDWFGAIIEYEGIAVEDCTDLHTRAWQTLALEEGKSQPFRWALKRAEGMKNEQVVQEVLLWSRNPMEVRRLCARKEELFRELRGDALPVMPPGTANLLDILQKHDVPVALACSAPEARVQPTLDALGLTSRLAAVITAEDVARGRPDPELYLYAAQQIGRPPARCVLIGNSNATVEAARDVGMAVVAVAGRTPVYDLTSADLVVRHLDELSFINLKQLFRSEEQVAFELEEELEEAPQQQPSLPTMTMDRW